MKTGNSAKKKLLYSVTGTTRNGYLKQFHDEWHQWDCGHDNRCDSDNNAMTTMTATVVQYYLCIVEEEGQQEVTEESKCHESSYSAQVL